MAAAPGNMTDPLAQLRDIHLPPAIDPGLPAPGWWLLGLAALALTVWSVNLAWRTWQARAYRREGIKRFNLLLAEFENHQNAQSYLTAYSSLLKQIAMTAYPRDRVAALSGEDWVDFLDKTTGSREFSMGAGQALIQGHYQNDYQSDYQNGYQNGYQSHYEGNASCDPEKLHNLAITWIKKHHKSLATEQSTLVVAP